MATYIDNILSLAQNRLKIRLTGTQGGGEQLTNWCIRKNYLIANIYIWLKIIAGELGCGSPGGFKHLSKLNTLTKREERDEKMKGKDGKALAKHKIK